MMPPMVFKIEATRHAEKQMIIGHTRLREVFRIHTMQHGESLAEHAIKEPS